MNTGRCRLRKMELMKFRSYANQQFRPDRNVTFLVGRNGAGKSNLLDALRFLSEIPSLPLESIVTKRGGSTGIFRRQSEPEPDPPEGFSFKIDIDLLLPDGRQASYNLRLRGLGSEDYYVYGEEIVVGDQSLKRLQNSLQHNDSTGFQPNLSAKALMLPAAGGLVEFAPLYEALKAITVYGVDPKKVAELQLVRDGSTMFADGSNAPGALRRLQSEDQDRFERLNDFLRAAVPGHRRVESKQAGEHHLSIEFAQIYSRLEEVSFPSSSMSEGTLRLLATLLALNSASPPWLICLEEPEIALHPGAMGVLADAINAASDQSQVIVSTQSPELLDAKWIKGENLRLIEWNEGVSSIKELAQGSKALIRKHLFTAGELLRSNALDSELPPERLQA